MNLTQQYRWNENVEAVEMEGQWVILHAEHNTITKLNEMGGFIWAMLQNGVDVSGIVAAVTEVFDVDKARAEADVEGFLEELRQIDVVVNQ